MSNTTNTTLADAIAAARAGRRDEAARILRQIVSADPFNVDAWVWLGGVASDPQEQRSALEQAVAIAPHNQRAQQGLDWLRQSRPELFTTASASATPRTDRSTPSYQQPAASSAAEPHHAAIYSTPSDTQPRIYDAPTQAVATPSDTQPRIYDAPTQAVPVQTTAEPVRAQSQYSALPQQTDRMSALPSPAYQEPARPAPYGGTDRMAVAPPPAVATAGPAERYDRRGNVSRWLLLLIWLFSFGAVATLAALIIVQPARFEPLVQPLLAQFGLRLVPDVIQTTGFVTAIVLIAVAVIDALVSLGILFRGRWAWVINLLVALLVTAGTVALAATYAVLAPTPISVGALQTNGALQILAGLSLFTLIYLILSFTSRRAFFRRRMQQIYGG
jgi:hypothetical protein